MGAARAGLAVQLALVSACLLLGAVSATPTHAATQFGKVTTMPYNRPTDGFYKVQIVAVNGEDAGIASHRRLPVGNNTVTVALLPNRAIRKNLGQLPGELMHKTLQIRVRTGLTYHVGARVDLEAATEAQRDGSFWEPVVTDVFRAR